MNLNLPYKIKYAELSFDNQKCESCGLKFYRSNLILAKMLQSTLNDENYPVWYHSQCFFAIQKEVHIRQIQNFENIIYEHQLEIILKTNFNKSEKNRTFRKRKCDEQVSCNNYAVEYSISDHECIKCSKKIEACTLHMRMFENDRKTSLDLFIHYTCFLNNRSEFKFVWGGEHLQGFESLPQADQIMTKSYLPPLNRIENLKRLRLFCDNPFDREVEMKIACQTAELFQVRQSLKKCEIVDLHVFLLINECKTSLHDEEELLDLCADILTFGLPLKCQKCHKGEMIFSKFGYTCDAWITEWIRCGNFEEYPQRSKCKIYEYFKTFDFFTTFQPQIRDRAVRSRVADDMITLPETSTREFSLRSNNEPDKPKESLCNATLVRCDNGSFFHCVLVLVDIEANKNSFFKLQIQEIKDSKANLSDLNVPCFFLSSIWGRIGTGISDSEIKNFASLQLASAEFEKKFQEKTGNDWKNRNNFIKVPGKFSPVEVIHNLNDFDATIPQVAELVGTLFDIEMTTASKKDSILLSKYMPLGKLSYEQYFDAISTLDKLGEAINSGSSQQVLVGLSNRFFTLFPHNFGFASVPVLDSQLKFFFKKLFTNYTLKYEKNNLITRYNRLNADIEYLSPLTAEFDIIKTYSERTSVHGYKIRILEVFKVHRFGETERYAPFKKFPNRYLLWHGSSILSFASIITNGLKITEMKNGSMFGRGIYFADMVSKSANYCKGLQDAGLLALCEVALGNIYETYKAQNFVCPPPNYDSVKGLGLNQPDMSQALKQHDGVIIPFGEAKEFSKSQILINQVVPNLNFNEYVIYNEAQIKIQYLIRFKKKCDM